MGAYLRHARLPFQLFLAPLFLWGLFLAGDIVWPGRAALGFASLHLFLYPGVTAFNAAYDRDEGPVSGMFAPPPVPPHLLAFSIALQAVGAVLAVGVGFGFALVYVALAATFAGYSHPALRWKARPVPSALTVAVGQGVLGFAGGGSRPARPGPRLCSLGARRWRG